MERINTTQHIAINRDHVAAHRAVRVFSSAEGAPVQGTALHRIERVVDHAVGWDAQGHRLTARSDRFGLQPLFYYADAREIVVSDGLETLARQGVPLEYDASALAVFLRLGYFVGDDTPFRRIRTVPPGAELIWDDGELSIRQVAAESTPRSDLSREAALDAFIDLFRASLKRLVEPEEKMIVPLSGGRDSRHILFELLHLGYRPDTITLRDVPPRYIDETVVARRIAEAAGVSHRIVDPTPGMVSRELRRNRLTHFCADEHAWLMAVPDAIAGQYDAIYDGLSGGVITSGTHLTPERLGHFRKRRFGFLADELLGSDDRLRFVLRPDALRLLSRERARERVIEELARHHGRQNPVASFIFTNRIRREVALASFSIMSTAGPVKVPFVWPPLVDFMFSLPPDHFLDHTFHTEAIHRAYPQFKSIPFQTEIGRAGSRGYSRHPILRKIKRRLLAVNQARSFVGDIYGYARSSPPSALTTSSWLPLGFIYDYVLMAGYAGVGPMSIYLNQLERLRQETSQP